MEAKLWKLGKLRYQTIKEPSEPSVKIYRKSKSGFTFTRGKIEEPKKQSSKKLNIIQKRNEKKERDTIISIQKQNERENIKLNIENIINLFCKSFK